MRKISRGEASRYRARTRKNHTPIIVRNAVPHTDATLPTAHSQTVLWSAIGTSQTLDMLKARCDKCQKTVFIDQETGHKFDSDSSDMPHREEITIEVNTVNEEWIAHLITNAAMNAGLDPFNVKTRWHGNKVTISQ